MSNKGQGMRASQGAATVPEATAAPTETPVVIPLIPAQNEPESPAPAERAVAAKVASTKAIPPSAV